MNIVLVRLFLKVLLAICVVKITQTALDFYRFSKVEQSLDRLLEKSIHESVYSLTTRVVNDNEKTLITNILNDLQRQIAPQLLDKLEDWSIVMTLEFIDENDEVVKVKTKEAKVYVNKE